MVEPRSHEYFLPRVPIGLSGRSCEGASGRRASTLLGALTAIRVARLDVVGVVTLGMITALGGGIIRDVLLGVHPPAAECLEDLKAEAAYDVENLGKMMNKVAVQENEKAESDILTRVEQQLDDSAPTA